MSNLWSKEMIIREIQRLHKDEVKLNSGSVRKTHRSLYSAAAYHYRGWKKAVEAAGFEYIKLSIVVFKEPRRTWSNKEIIEAIHELRDKNEELNSRHVAQNHSRLYAAARHHFLSWKVALKASGLNEEVIRKIPPFRVWTKEIVIEAIRSRYAAGQLLNSHAVEKSDLTLYQSGKRHFGNWAVALKAAGFDPKKIYLARPLAWTKSEFAQAIGTLQSQDIELSMVNMVRLGRGDLLNGARKLYGGWREGLQSLGLNYGDIKERRDAWTADEVILIIQHLASEGHRLSHGWAKLNHNGLTHAARFHFGKWDCALTAAGLNYREHAKYWSTEAWLRHLSDGEYGALLVSSGKNTT